MSKVSKDKPHIKKLSRSDLKVLKRIIDRRLRSDYTQEELENGIELSDFRTYSNYRILYGQDFIDKLIRDRIEALTDPK